MYGVPADVNAMSGWDSGINYGSFCVCSLLLKAICRLHQVDFEFMLNNSIVSGGLSVFHL